MKKVSFAGNKLRHMEDPLFTLSSLENICMNQNRLEDVNPAITKLTSLTSLELCANKLSSFNYNLNLMRLDLSANRFTSLSFAISSLTFLDISQNDLDSFPVLDCPNLKQVNASYNDITCIPDQITLLCSLRSCDLSHNNIKELPKGFSLLTALTMLHLNNNPISGVPPNFSSMRIRKLNASYTNGFNFGKMDGLKELIYKGVKVDLLYDDYGSLKNLEHLDVSENHFKSIRATSPSLITLSVNQNQLTQLIVDTSCAVQKLNARYNQLTSIDPTITTNPKMSFVDLSNNLIESMPLKLDIPRLQYLNLGFNKLTSIDSDYSRLTNLTHLNISFNNLVTLSTQISTVTPLQTLFIAGNKLTTLPECMSTLTNLKSLHCGENKFFSFPSVILTLTSLTKL